MAKQFHNGQTMVMECQECDSCQVSYINGMKCHEIGCPSAWKDYAVECRNCDNVFYPEFKGQECCNQDCYDDYWNL